MNYLNFHRSIKTGYGLACMREVRKTAVMGHRAAYKTFLSGMSEFDINLAYLMATGHHDTDVPYDNIVALNEHTSVLHYTKLDHQPSDETLSFLIDVDAEYNGYVADLTRTYAVHGSSEFTCLVKDLNNEQLVLIATVKAGMHYTDYHVKLHQRIEDMTCNLNLA